MSFQDSWIECDRCHKKFSTDILAGRFFYELGDGTKIPIKRKFGWCRSCNTLSPVEDLDPSHLAKEISELKVELSEHAGFLKQFSEHHKGHADRIIENLLQLEQQFAFAQSRERPEKCLNCGSDSFLEVPTNLIEWSHPNCGGSFTPKTSEVFYTDIFPLRIYNEDGTLNREIETEW